MNEPVYDHDHYYGYPGDKPEHAPVWLALFVVTYVVVETICWIYSKVVF